MLEFVRNFTRKHAILTPASTSQAVVEHRTHTRRHTRCIVRRCHLPIKCIAGFSTSSIVSATFFQLLFYTARSFADAARKSACEESQGCSKYECDAEHSFHSPMDYFVKPGRSIFSRPCKCQSDWKAHFCKNSARYRLTGIENESSLPSVCICRQFSDNGRNCQQFMTQCFTERQRGQPCYCCFNQPGLYCNQLQCSNGQPEFGPKSNTTCVCHLPAFYPYHICTQEDLLGVADVDSSVPFDWRVHVNVSDIAQHERKRNEKKFKLMGLEMTPALAFAVVLSLLGVVALMTALLLIMRSCRLQKQRRQNDMRRNNAQTILLQQRAEEDKYLP
uniref:EGF-like domain-containing protein n=1 Tax=Parascaris univalens TaxID=6257 RepID=A0A914ZKT6_PARUN